MRGFAVDLWRRLAARLNLTCTYELSSTGSYRELLQRLEMDDIDAIASGNFIRFNHNHHSSQRRHPKQQQQQQQRQQRQQPQPLEPLQYSAAFWYSGLRILTSASIDYSVLGTPALWHTMGVLVLLIVVAGHVYYLLERETAAESRIRERAKRSPLVNQAALHRLEYDERSTMPVHRAYWEGMPQGVWWACVTMTSVGYGDYSPRRDRGKAFGLAWMIFSLLMLSFVTSTVTSALTMAALEKETITDIASLDDRVVGVVDGSLAHSFLLTRRSALHGIHRSQVRTRDHNRDHNHHEQQHQHQHQHQQHHSGDPSFAPLVLYRTHQELVSGVKAQRVEAGVGQADALEYLASHRVSKGAVKLVGMRFQMHAMGFALGPALARSHAKAINAALLDLQDSPEYDELVQLYFNSNNNDDAGTLSAPSSSSSSSSSQPFDDNNERGDP